MFSWLSSSNDESYTKPPPSTSYAPQRRQVQRSALNQSRSPYGRPEPSQATVQKSESEPSFFDSITATLAAPVSWFTSPTVDEGKIEVAPPEAPKQKGGVGQPNAVRVGTLCGDMTWLGSAEGDKRNAVFTGRNLNMRKEVISDFWMKPRALPSFSKLSSGWYSQSDPEDENKTIGEGGDSPAEIGVPGLPATWRNESNSTREQHASAELPASLDLDTLSLAALNPPPKRMAQSALPVPIKASPADNKGADVVPFPARANARAIERRTTPFRRPPSARRMREAAASDEGEAVPSWSQPSPAGRDSAAGKWRSSSPGLRQGLSQGITRQDGTATRDLAAPSAEAGYSACSPSPLQPASEHGAGSMRPAPPSHVDVERRLSSLRLGTASDGPGDALSHTPSAREGMFQQRSLDRSESLSAGQAMPSRSYGSPAGDVGAHGTAPNRLL